MLLYEREKKINIEKELMVKTEEVASNEVNRLILDEIIADNK